MYYDISCSPEDIDMKTVKEINKMEPFGQDNPSISLLIERANVKDYSTMGKDKNHYRASFVKSNEGIKSVGFFFISIRWCCIRQYDV